MGKLVEDIRGQLIQGEDGYLLDPNYFIEWMRFARLFVPMNLAF